MSFLQDKCSLFVPNQPTDMHGFSCGDEDLDAFFASDCFAYAKQLLGKTYCYRLDSDKKTIVSAFTLANAGIRVSDLPNSRKKKVEADIPHVKTLKDYPAVLIGRLGVSKDFRSMHVGSDILEYIKYWFFDSNNKKVADSSLLMLITMLQQRPFTNVMASKRSSVQTSKKKNTDI